MAGHSEEFRFAEFASARQKGFRNNIVNISDLPKLIKKHGAYECYSSIFTFNDEILEYMKNNIIKGKPSVSGFDGTLYATYFPVDIDCKDIGHARRIALDTISALESIGLNKAGIKVYFSGSKGFHIESDSRFFGVQPVKGLNLYFSEMRRRLAKSLGRDGTLIDQKIKDAVRLWRLPNTRNSKSGLYKVKIYHDELEGLNIDEIKGIAHNPRVLYDTDPTGIIPKHYIGLSNKANRFYHDSVDSVESRFKGKSGFSYASNGFKPYGMCKAKRNIFTSHIDEGERNNCALILASYFRESGKSYDSARKHILGWNMVRKIGLSVSEIETVVKSAYSKKEPYVFGCSSLGKFCPYTNRKGCKSYRKSNG